MKKIKRLILHIGTPKTGSTSIQESLGNSRQILLRNNVHYPTVQPYNHIFNFVPIFLDDPNVALPFKLLQITGDEKNTKVQNYRKLWENEIRSCTKDYFIISAEDFTLPYFTEDAVNRLKIFVEQFFDEITIIAYVRHYDQWIPSQIQQAVKNGMNSELVELIEHFLKCPPRMAYRKIFRKWIKAFGKENIVIRPFDPKVFHNDRLLDDFFLACNLPVKNDLIPEIRSNESIGKNAVLFLQEYNKSYPRIVNGVLNKNRGLAELGLPFDIFNNIDDEKFRLELIYSPKQAQKFNKEIDFINSFFTDGYQFHHVNPGTGKLIIPNTKEIPIKFFVEVFNSYNKQLEIFKKPVSDYKQIINTIRIPFFRSILTNPKIKISIKKMLKWDTHEK